MTTGIYPDRIETEMSDTHPNPEAGSMGIYPKLDGNWYRRNAAGTETILGSAESLDGLSDVIITSVLQRQGLFYDGNHFVNTYPGVVPLGWTKLSSSGVISVTPIPTTFRSLRVILTVKAAAAIGSDAFYSQINADTTAANYRGQYLFGNNAGFLAAQNIGATPTITNVNVIGNLGPTGLWNGIVIDFPDYATAGKHKTCILTSFLPFNTTSGNLYVGFQGGAWLGTAAITRLDFKVAGGDLLYDSTCEVYGKYT